MALPLLLSFLCFAPFYVALVASQKLACDPLSPPDECQINSAVVLNAGTWTCCDEESFSFGQDGSLSCAPGADCSILINVTKDVTISVLPSPSSSQIYLPTTSSEANSLTIISGNKISLSGANITAGVIKLESTNPSSTVNGITCTNSILSSSGQGDNLATTPGTPKYPGATIYGSNPPAGRGLGASHGGAGSTGYDASPTSLFEASKTYPSDPFDLPNVPLSLLLGSKGGRNNVSTYGGANTPGIGGGLVWLFSPSSITSLSGCSLLADGAPGIDAGGGSGGSIIVDALSINVVLAGTKASAEGGGVVATSQATACTRTVPCGLPGGGGIVFARSGASTPKPLSKWGSSGGGRLLSLTGLCGGAGLLVDCQNNVDEDTDCDVVVSGVAACATPSLIASACIDGQTPQPAGAVPNFNGACLAPPTTLNCGMYDCGAVTLSNGANLTLLPAVISNRTITGTSSYISSFDFQPTLSARLGVSLTDVTITTPSDGLPRNYTVESTTSTLLWVASNMSLVGSLAVSSGLALNVTFNSVNISAPFSFLNSSQCHTPTLDGALLLSSGNACVVPYGPSFCSLTQGALTFGGSMNAVSFGAYAYSDIFILGGSVTTAGCASGVGPGGGSTALVTGGNSIGFSVGGGAGHHSVGGQQVNSQASSGNGGQAYDTNPFVLYPPIPFGGSGGGGNMSVGGTYGIGGSGGGTIVLVGNGTLRNPGSFPMTLSASGTASVTGGAIAPYGIYPSGGGGSGGSVVIAFSSFNEVTDGPALQTLTLSAQGGAGGYTLAPIGGTSGICGGGGSGGNVIVAVPFKSSAPAPTITPKVFVSGGSATLACSPGPAGTAVYTILPASKSFSMTPTSSVAPTFTASGTATASATATSSSSASASAMETSSATFSSSSSPSPSASSSSAASSSALAPTQSATSTPSVTPTPSPTLSASSTGTPSVSPSPAPPQILGLKVPEFIAVSAGTGSVVFLIAVWLIARAVCAPRVKTGMLIPSSSGGSLWGGNAGGTDMDSIFDDPRERYVPPTGVV